MSLSLKRQAKIRILSQCLEQILLKNKEVCQNAHLLFYAQSPDFHKLGLCYYLKNLYL